MKNLREIRERIKGIKKTQQITKAMKMVSAVRFKKTSSKLISNRPYADSIANLVSDLVIRVGEKATHPFFIRNEKSNKSLLVVIGSDKGLCGSFNSNLLRYCLKYLNEKKDKEIHIITIGKKVNDYLKKRDYNIINSWLNISFNLSYDTASKIEEQIVGLFLKEKYKEVNILYNEFKNAAQTKITLKKLLPLESIEKEKNKTEFIYEPNPEEVLKELLPRFMKVIVCRILLESNVSEQGLRMTAMEQATKNADDMIKNLTLLYNKSRQTNITKELADVVGGAEAVA
ncbi:MAG: ATP synthase F1 subunit gamma [Candidatus Firestonebacteria bacterium]